MEEDFPINIDTTEPACVHDMHIEVQEVVAVYDEEEGEIYEE